MPIVGITNNRGAAFPKIGVLRKGAEKPDEKRPGRDLDHFRFDTEDAAAAAAFVAAYGQEPRDINVYLPFARVDENFQAWKEAWKAGGLLHRCDGETCAIWRTPDGTYSQEPKPCPGGCKAVGRLSVVIPELKRLAYVTVQTTSIHDVITLQQNLEAAAVLRQGDLRGIPFILSRRPREISMPDNRGNGRVRREKWLLSIEPAPVWVGMQLQAMDASARPIARLPDHQRLITATGEIIDAEPDEEDHGEIVSVDGQRESDDLTPEQRFWFTLADAIGSPSSRDVNWEAARHYLNTTKRMPADDDGWQRAEAAVRAEQARRAAAEEDYPPEPVDNESLFSVREPALPRQIAMLQRLAAERGIDIAAELHGEALDDLSFDQAGDLITAWQHRPRVASEVSA